jgi:hypothetical protein
MNSGTAVWDLSRENTGEKRDSAFLQERGISVGVGACEPAIRSISSSLGIFFVWTFATNQATNNWTVVPKNWNTLRMQWEYSRRQRRRDVCGLGVRGYLGPSTAIASEMKVVVGRPSTLWRNGSPVQVTERACPIRPPRTTGREDSRPPTVPIGIERLLSAT